MDCDHYSNLLLRIQQDASSVTEEEVEQMERHLAECPCKRRSFENGIERLLEDVRMGD